MAKTTMLKLDENGRFVPCQTLTALTFEFPSYPAAEPLQQPGMPPPALANVFDGVFDA